MSHIINFLKDREINPLGNKRVRHSLPPCFNLKECQPLNPYPEEPSRWKFNFLKKKSKVQEILCIHDASLLISLQHSGITCVFKNQGNCFKQFGYLNHRPDEIIRSLFHNQISNSIVIVSVYPEDKKAILRCRSILIEDIIKGQFHLSTPIVEKEILEYPGWIELCEVNSKILTYIAETETYKVWSLKDYSFLFSISSNASTSSEEEEKLVDVKASPGFLLLLYEPTSTDNGISFTQKIRLIDVHTGEELYVLNHPLKSKIELVEQFCDTILIKELDQNLMIHHIRKQINQEINVSSNQRLNAFTFLHNSRTFLTFQEGGKVVSYNSVGEQISTIYEEEDESIVEEILGGEDGSIVVGNKSTALMEKNPIVLVARDQETLLSLKKGYDPDDLLARIFSPETQHPQSYIEFKNCKTGKTIQSIPCHANYADITSICFEEEKMLLFLGMKDGTIKMWM